MNNVKQPETRTRYFSRSKPLLSADHSDKTDDEEGWQEFVSQKLKKRLRSPPDLCGPSSLYKTVFVSNIKHGNLKSIKKYLDERTISFGDITKTSHKDAKYSSFKIKVSSKQADKLLSRSF